MGPDAYRTAGLAEALEELGHGVTDIGNIKPDANDIAERDDLFRLKETVGWTTALERVAKTEAGNGMPIFMGGDHSLSLGSIAGLAEHANELGRPLFILWLDAHSDFHTPATTDSGHLHGTPLAYIAGFEGFDDFPKFKYPVPTSQIAAIGLRSVDKAEREALSKTDVAVTDMRAMDEFGIKAPLVEFLEKVKAANGLLHVSFDVDFLEPTIAPAVVTTVPGGATEREAHLAMELLCDSGLVTSLDLVELNPILDDRGKTAYLMVDFVASLMGRRVFDRPNISLPRK